MENNAAYQAFKWPTRRYKPAKKLDLLSSIYSLQSGRYTVQLHRLVNQTHSTMSWLSNLSYVWHIHAPIHHIFLSCHRSSPEVHGECPILRGSEGVWITHEAESRLLSSSCHLCLCLCFSPPRFWQADTKALFHPCSFKLRMTLQVEKHCGEWHLTADEQREPV